MAQQLLKTKFHLPATRADVVRRSRLTTLIDQGRQGRLTLISAPPGSGKSTLVSEWRESEMGSASQFAWLSLDEADNDPVRFFTYFAAALDGLRPGIGEAGASLFRGPDTGIDHTEVLTALINEIAEIGDDFVLGLDDYHVITDGQIHELMAMLVEQMPTQMHLLITTRHDPPLPLARLRARGELTEIRAADLQLDADEAAAMLAAADEASLPDSVLADLIERTEGWAAGLHLFILSTRGLKMSASELEQRVESFTGDKSFVFDYLAGEIFERSDEKMRDFLVKTSLLERMTGPLCDSVTDSDDGEKMLRQIGEQNLFLIPLDDERRWYRYHHLFQEFLRSRAAESGTEVLGDVHRRAAAWFEDHGMAAQAIDQAHAGGDHETVARLLAANFEEFRRIGYFGSISTWSKSLPEEMVRERPRLALIRASVAMAFDDNHRNARRIASWAEEAIKLIDDGGGFDPSQDRDGTVVGPDGLDALRGEMLAMRLTLSSRNLTPKEIADLSDRALELLPPGNHRVRGMLHMTVIGRTMEHGDMSSALSRIERVIAEARNAENYSLLTMALAFRGQINVVGGRLEDGIRSYNDALRARPDAMVAAAIVMCMPHSMLAAALLERGDIPGASDHAAKAVEFADKSPTRSPVLNARAVAAEVLLAAGESEAATVQLAAAQEFVQGSSDTRFESSLSAVKLSFYCRNIDLESAEDVVRERELTPAVVVDRDNEEEATSYGRHLILRGDYSDAVEVLSKAIQVVQDAGRVQHEIHALALQSLAYELTGERALALEALGRATMLGEPGHFNRTFTAEGPVMTGLLGALADAVRRNRGPEESGSPSYLGFLLQEMSAVSTSGSEPATEFSPDAAGSAALASLPEPLTERETEVLALIASGASNQQIAEQLVVSMSTVKTHINRTYRKLDARSRTQAVAKGRQLGIV